MSENYYGAFTTGQIELLKKAADLNGLKVLGCAWCQFDPEDGSISIKSDQTGLKLHDKEWNFLYPVYLKDCRCDGEGEIHELLRSELLLGHYPNCLDSVPKYLNSATSVLRLYRYLREKFPAIYNSQHSKSHLLDCLADYQYERAITILVN